MSGRLGNTEFADLSYLKWVVSHEVVLGQLYSAISKAVPKHADIWAELAREEITHAQQLERLEGNIADDEVHFKPDRASTKAVSEDIDFMRKQIQRVKLIGISADDAVLLGLKLERSLVEKQFFMNLETVFPELQEVFDYIAMESAEHYERIEKLAGSAPLCPPIVRRLAAQFRDRLKGLSGAPDADH